MPGSPGENVTSRRSFSTTLLCITTFICTHSPFFYSRWVHSWDYGRLAGTRVYPWITTACLDGWMVRSPGWGLLTIHGQRERRVGDGTPQGIEIGGRAGVEVE